MTSASDINKQINQTQDQLSAQSQDADATKAKSMSTAASGLQDVDFNSELAGLKLASILGGPLTASIKGMTIAAANTIEFIRRVGFTPGPNGQLGEPVMLSFSLSKPSGPLGMMQSKNTVVTVPFLTMVHLPFLRLDMVSIEFNVKLTSTRTQDLASTTGATVISTNTASTTKSKQTGTWQTADSLTNTTTKTANTDPNTSSTTPFYYDKSQTTSSTETPLNVDSDDWTKESSMIGITTSKVDSKSGNTISKEYSLNILIEAKQDALPPGLEKLLDILEQEVKDSALQDNTEQVMSKLMPGAK